MRLAVNLSSVGEIDLLACDGEIDFGTSDCFETALGTVILDRAGQVLVDLRGVAFMDSTGIHHLVATQRRLTLQGRQFALLCAPGPVLDVFHTAGMLEQLGVHDSPAAAESALG
jgi:anti-sigma B factor antagonist